MKTIGPYAVREELGRGAMGIVYRAFDPQANREVAIKLLHVGVTDSLDVERFRREAEAAARIRHKNVVAVHEFGWDGPHPYLVMEFVEGESLAARLKHRGPMDSLEAARIGACLARALQQAHEVSVLHRDMKPDNVLLTPEGIPLVSDFGVARLGDKGRLTATGAALGTPAFMPPEQVMGERSRIDARADVYSLGATLYAMLTGQPPFVGGSALSTMAKVTSEAVRRPSELRPVSAALESVVLRCLEKEPGDRYASAADLADALDSVVSGGGKKEAWSDGRRPLVAAIAVAVLFAVTAGLVATRGPGPATAGEDGGVAPVAPVESETQGVASSPTAGASPGALAATGMLEFERGDMVRARFAFEAALATEPRHGEALLGLAKVLFWWGDHEESLRVLGKVPGGDEISAVLCARAENLVSLAKGEEALGLCDLAVGLDLGEAQVETFLTRGRVRWRLDQLKGALKETGRALRVDTECVEAFALRSQVQRQMGSSALAEQVASRGLGIDSDNVAAHFARAYALFSLGRFDDVSVELRSVTDLYPRHAEARYLLGYLYHKQAEAERSAIQKEKTQKRAAAQYERALKIVPGYPDATIQLAKLDIALGRPEAARDRILALIAASPWCSGGYRQLAGLYKIAGDSAEELNALNETIKRCPAEQARDFYDRASAKGRLRQADGAFSDLERAVELDKGRTHEFVFSLGLALRHRDRFPEAKSMLVRAVRLKPNDFYSIYHLGEVKALLNDRKAAALDFTRALDLKNLKPEQLAIARLQRGWARQSLGEHDLAVDDYRESLRLAPDHRKAKDTRRRIKLLTSAR